MNRVLDIGLLVLLAIGFGMIVARMVEDHRRYGAARRYFAATRLARVGLLVSPAYATLDNKDRIDRWEAKRRGEWPIA